MTISASSASFSIVAARVEPAPPQATISLVDEADGVALAEATLGIVASRRGDAAGGDAASASSSRSAFSSAAAAGSSSTRASRLFCSDVAATTRAGFSESSQARSAAMITLEELGKTSTSSAGDLVDTGQQLVGRGVERLAAGDDVGAELAEEPLQSLPCGHREGAGAPALEPGAALGDLLAHVGDVEVGHLAGVLEERRPPPRARRCGRGP